MNRTFVIPAHAGIQDAHGRTFAEVTNFEKTLTLVPVACRQAGALC